MKPMMRIILAERETKCKKLLTIMVTLINLDNKRNEVKKMMNLDKGIL